MDNENQIKNPLPSMIFYATLAALFIYLSFFLITQSKLFVKTVIVSSFNHSFDSVKIVDLSFNEHLFDFPGFYHFSDIDLVLEDGKKKRWVVDSEEISLRCENCFKKTRRLIVDIEDVDVSYDNQLKMDDLNVDVDVDLQGWTPWKTSGGLTIHAIQYGAVQAEAVQASITGFKRELSINNIWFKSLEGVIKGEIFLELIENFAYSANMQFVDVDVRRLGDEADIITSNVQGVFDGFFEIKGVADAVEQINGRFILSKNGMLHSRLMKNLIEYIPASAITENLSQAIKQNMFIPIDEMEVTFSNNSEQSIMTRNRIVSREYNIDANLNVDVKDGIRLFNFQNLIQD